MASTHPNVLMFVYTPLCVMTRWGETGRRGVTRGKMGERSFRDVMCGDSVSRTHLPYIARACGLPANNILIIYRGASTPGDLHCHHRGHISRWWGR